MSMKMILGGAVLVLATVGIIVWGLTEDKPSALPLDQSKITYFYGETCPYCKNVLQFLEENKIAEKVAFEKREVWKDRANAKMMEEAAGVCGLDSQNVGVPFLFAEGKCFIGEPDVIKFFKEKAGL